LVENLCKMLSSNYPANLNELLTPYPSFAGRKTWCWNKFYAVFLFVVSMRRTVLRTVREEILEMEMANREPAYVALYETTKK